MNDENKKIDDELKTEKLNSARSFRKENDEEILKDKIVVESVKSPRKNSKIQSLLLNNESSEDEDEVIENSEKSVEKINGNGSSTSTSSKNYNIEKLKLDIAELRIVSFYFNFNNLRNVKK